MSGTLSVAIPEIVAENVCAVEGVDAVEGDRTREMAVDVVASVRQSRGMVSVYVHPEAIADFSTALTSGLQKRLFEGNADPHTEDAELTVISLRSDERISKDYRLTPDSHGGARPDWTNELDDLLRTASEQV